MPDQVTLSDKERQVLKKIAERDGITEEEAASNLVKGALERRVRRRTGKGPAKVYSLPKRTPA